MRHVCRMYMYTDNFTGKTSFWMPKWMKVGIQVNTYGGMPFCWTMLLFVLLTIWDVTEDLAYSLWI